MSNEVKDRGLRLSPNERYILDDEDFVVVIIDSRHPDYIEKRKRYFSRMVNCFNLFHGVEEPVLYTALHSPSEAQKLALAVLREPGNNAPLAALIDDVADRINYPGEKHATNKELRDMLLEIADIFWVRKPSTTSYRANTIKQDILQKLKIHCKCCMGKGMVYTRHYAEEPGEWSECIVCRGTGRSDLIESNSTGT